MAERAPRAIVTSEDYTGICDLLQAAERDDLWVDVYWDYGREGGGATKTKVTTVYERRGLLRRRLEMLVLLDSGLLEITASKITKVVLYA